MISPVLRSSPIFACCGRPTKDKRCGLPSLYVPLKVGNDLDGRAFGFEIIAEYRPLQCWQLYAAYSYLDIGGGLDDVDPNRVTLAQAGFNAEHQVVLHARFDPAARWQVDGQMRYIGELVDFEVDAYFELDLRLARQVGDSRTKPSP